MTPREPGPEGLLAALLEAMDALAQAGRRMHPPRLAEVAAAAAPYRSPLAEALAGLEAAEGPEQPAPMREGCVAAAELLLRAFDELAAASDPPGVYRALRSGTRAQEALWPVAALLPQVSRFFLPPQRRDDAELLARLAAATGVAGRSAWRTPRTTAGSAAASRSTSRSTTTFRRSGRWSSPCTAAPGTAATSSGRGCRPRARRARS